MPVLQTVDLKNYYQQGETVTKALDGVSLEINAGEFVSVVGTSGSGKSDVYKRQLLSGSFATKEVRRS